MDPGKSKHQNLGPEPGRTIISDESSNSKLQETYVQAWRRPRRALFSITTSIKSGSKLGPNTSLEQSSSFRFPGTIGQAGTHPCGASFAIKPSNKYHSLTRETTNTAESKPARPVAEGLPCFETIRATTSGESAKKVIKNGEQAASNRIYFSDDEFKLAGC